MKKAAALLLCLAMILCSMTAVSESRMLPVYQSDFPKNTDGWYARSSGTAYLRQENGSLIIKGRNDNWNSPGRDFELMPGVYYEMSVKVKQDEMSSALFMISIAHKEGTTETYENLGSIWVPKGEWVELTGSWQASKFDSYVLYVETVNAPKLSYAIKDFILTSEVTEATAVNTASGDPLYRSDFSGNTDGWYPRSNGTAKLRLEDGALMIEGRADSWHSPGRDFNLIPSATYEMSVKVKQDEVSSALFIISIAHKSGYTETYENLGSVRAARGEWAEITATWQAGEYDSYVIYVETSGAPKLSYAIKDFVITDSFRKPGNFVTFGRYPQTTSGTDSTPIWWFVLDYDSVNRRALLISWYGLDTQPYNTEKAYVTWEQCTLRAWLNNDFLNKAFTAKERSAILLTDLDNSDIARLDDRTAVGSAPANPGGSNTRDKIFLLSEKEATKYFGVQNWDVRGSRDNILASVEPTPWAIQQGALKYTKIVPRYTESGAIAGYWLLRTYVTGNNVITAVDSNGSFWGFQVDDKDSCIRPALWIDLR